MQGSPPPKYGQKYSKLQLAINIIVDIKVELGGFIPYFFIDKLSKPYTTMIFRA